MDVDIDTEKKILSTLELKIQTMMELVEKLK